MSAGSPELLSPSVDTGSDTSDLETEDSGLDYADDTHSATDDGVLVFDEERRSGVVRLSVYWSYWTAVGRCLATIVLMSILLMQGAVSAYMIIMAPSLGHP